MSSIEPGPPKRRLVVRMSIAGVMAAVAVVSIVVWLSLREGSSLGTLVEVGSQVKGTSTVVNLPYGAMTLNVTEPVDELPLGVNDDVDSGHWVGVSWATLPSDVSKAQQSIGLDFTRTAEVVLIADGDRFDLLAGQSQTSNLRGPLLDKSVYVALPETPTEVVVEVTYDGVTQRFTPGMRNLNTARASGLYASPTWTISAPECDNEWTITAPGFEFYGGDNVVTCRILDASSTPYLEGKGWAQEGRSWLVVPILTNALNPLATWPTLETDPSQLYALKLRDTIAEVNGEPPAAVLNYYQGAPDELREGLTGARYVFDVPYAGNRTLVFRQDYDSDPKTSELPDAPEQASGTATFTATLKQTP